MTTSPASKEQVSKWMDLSKGLVSRDVFVDENIYSLELEQIFSKTWLLIGHEIGA